LALAAAYRVAAGSVSKGLSREDFQVIGMLRAGALCREPSASPSSCAASAIYGLYSRHGCFHGPDLPPPEVHCPDFIRSTLLRQD
jgi:hypothetical protein